MTEKTDNFAVIQAFSEAVMGGDAEAVARLAHPEFVVQQAAGLPYGGTHKGLDAFYAMLGRMQEVWRELKISPLGVIGDPAGQEFALHMLVEGRAHDGAPMSSEVFERWIVRDGKVAEIWPFYHDTASLAKQFGPAFSGESER
ncbi:MAG: hypothetical protein RIQ46_158 [Pseudomonadota bacterium]|jgi:ketosteroid isomerase-like protein